MPAHLKVVGEESSAYLALVVAAWDMDQLTTRYIECLEQERPFARTVPGALYGLSIIQKRHQAMAPGSGRLRAVCGAFAMLQILCG